MNARLVWSDTTGAVVAGVQVSVIINGTSVSTVGTYRPVWSSRCKPDSTVRCTSWLHDLNAEFVGTPGTTGLVGDNATVRFVVLGETNISITESSETITAGDSYM